VAVPRIAGPVLVPYAALFRHLQQHRKQQPHLLLQRSLHQPNVQALSQPPLIAPQQRRSRSCICALSRTRPSHRSSRRSCCRNSPCTCACTKPCNSTRCRRRNGACSSPCYRLTNSSRPCSCNSTLASRGLAHPVMLLTQPVTEARIRPRRASGIAYVSRPPSRPALIVPRSSLIAHLSSLSA
jgi:hypothetical protein